MTTETTIESIQFTNLPALGAEFEGGKFAGITTQKDGTHVAVILLPNKAQELIWKKAMNWAEKLKAELPSRPVAALLFANVKSELDPKWHWTNETHQDDSSSAWGCYFHDGHQYDYHKSYDGCAVVVRLIPLTA
jgi:hypothetical protein